jgi:hypothetical protein
MKNVTIFIITILFAQLSFSQTMYIHTRSNGIDSIMISQIDSITFTVQGSPPTDSLVAYYPFNGNPNDESGNGHNGVDSSATLTTDRFGNANKAYSFDGVSNYIQVNGFPILDNTFTYSAWIKVTRPSGVDINNNFGNFGTSGTGVETWGMSYNVTTQRLWISDHLNGAYAYVTVLGNNWRYVVVKYNGTTRSLYLDGTLVASQNITTPIPSLPTDFLRIGSHTDHVAQQFMGSIDDIRIYNRALSDAEIQALYHEGGW